jgi:hypothetical protein
MDPRLLQLLGPTLSKVPAQQANEAIARERVERASGGQPLRSYEIVLSTFEVFARDQLPKLVYHLESVGAHLPHARGVLIAAFLGDQLHFLDAGALIGEACRLLGVTPEALAVMHGTGERRTAIRNPDERN